MYEWAQRPPSIELTCETEESRERANFVKFETLEPLNTYTTAPAIKPYLGHFQPSLYTHKQQQIGKNYSARASISVGLFHEV